MDGKITLVAVFYNEEAKLGGYFANVKGVVDEMVVVDCGSSDRTGEICRKAGATVIESSNRYFEQNVNKALARVQSPWVLILDADERLSPELKGEIKNAIQRPDADVFYINRINYLFDGFSTKSSINTYLPRLFRKGRVSWEMEMPHEIPKVSGRTARLKPLFYHYAFVGVPSFIRKMEEYLCRLPSEYAKKGKDKVLIAERNRMVALLFGTHGLRRLFIYPVAISLEHMLVRRLIFDGMRGVVFSIATGIYAFLEEAIHWETESKKKSLTAIDWGREFPDGRH